MSCPGCDGTGNHTYSASDCQLAKVRDHFGDDDRWETHSTASNEDDE